MQKIVNQSDAECPECGDVIPKGGFVYTDEVIDNFICEECKEGLTCSHCGEIGGACHLCKMD